MYAMSATIPGAQLLCVEARSERPIRCGPPINRNQYRTCRRHVARGVERLRIALYQSAGSRGVLSRMDVASAFLLYFQPRTVL